MTRLRDNLVSGVAAATLLGITQAIVGTALVAVVYRGLIVAPRDFFNVRLADGYTKALSLISATCHLPMPPDGFIGQGLWVKASMLPGLLSVNFVAGLAVGVAVASAVAGARRRRRPLSVAEFVLLVASLELALHVAMWATHVHLPKHPTAVIIAKNYARNFIHDGTLAALVSLLVATVIALVLGRVGGERGALATAAFFGAAGFLCLSLGAGRPATGSEAGDAGSLSGAAAQDSGPAEGGGAVAAGYNVILISIDTLRADHTSAYGYGRDTTPTLRALAGGGARFARHSSTTSWTLPAHLSMLTGRLQLAHGVLDDRHRLAPAVPTLAERLRQAGYTTGAVVSAPYLNHRYGFDRGFDHYDDETVHWATHGESYKHVTAPLVQGAADAWLEQHASRRFFLFLHYWDPHYDYAPGKPYDTLYDPEYRGSITGDDLYFNPAVNRHMKRRDLDHIIALYDGEIRLVDDHLAKLRATLARLGLTDRTLLVVTADHGEEFFEHGYKGHRRSLYGEVLRVPLIIDVPGVRPTKPVVKMETSIADVAPTILALLGLPPLEIAEGIELASVAFGGRREWSRRTIAELYRPESLNVQVSVRERDHKIIHHFNAARMEVYDLAADPGEHTPLPASTAFAAALARRLAAYMNSAWPAFRMRLTTGRENRLLMDPETEERLRALGYVD